MRMEYDHIAHIPAARRGGSLRRSIWAGGTRKMSLMAAAKRLPLGMIAYGPLAEDVEG